MHACNGMNSSAKNTQPSERRAKHTPSAYTAAAQQSAQLAIAVHEYLECVCDEQLRIDSHRSHSHSHAACLSTLQLSLLLSLSVDSGVLDVHAEWTRAQYDESDKFYYFSIYYYWVQFCRRRCEANARKRERERCTTKRMRTWLAHTDIYSWHIFQWSSHIKCERIKKTKQPRKSKCCRLRCAFANAHKIRWRRLLLFLFSYVLSTIIKRVREKIKFRYGV